MSLRGETSLNWKIDRWNCFAGGVVDCYRNLFALGGAGLGSPTEAWEPPQQGQGSPERLGGAPGWQQRTGGQAARELWQMVAVHPARQRRHLRRRQY